MENSTGCFTVASEIPCDKFIIVTIIAIQQHATPTQQLVLTLQFTKGVVRGDHSRFGSLTANIFLDDYQISWTKNPTSVNRLITTCATPECVQCPALAVDPPEAWDPVCCADPTMASGSGRSTTAAVPVDPTDAARATGPTADIVSLLRRKVGFAHPQF
nr:uncharacterized protein LOC108068714 [Drosophila takahashii]